MQIGLNVMGVEALCGGDVEGMLQVVTEADRKGVDLISISDHLGFQKSAHATRGKTHNFPFVLEQPWYEPISFLSAAAMVTKRVRLSTFVLIAPLRPTLLLAKQLATLDVISKGRVTIALGVGWQAEEFRAAGMPFEGRFGDLDDQVGGMRALWGRPPAAFTGRNFAFEDFYSYPQPVQGQDLPILLGFNPTPKNIDRIARLAQGWAVDPAYRSIFADKVKELRAAWAQHGREPGKIEIHVAQGVVRTADGALDLAAIKAGAKALEAEGATMVTMRLADFCRTRADIDGMLDFAVSLKG
ncbi:TIGR03619 family F420-dependent LLM class oxidoreductase [Phenylobacterium sp.]|jgi:probable F420-dependent oxidoreductase|uniref:TIGR03619 family F420-dependent LLM class oxidoreductase n=1 Tax=Phenylobacterium sp. TaxID=1871053 RepID=UPI002F41231D